MYEVCTLLWERKINAKNEQEIVARDGTEAGYRQKVLESVSFSSLTHSLDLGM